MSGARVVVDGRMVSEVTHGIARYVRMIAKGLAERPSLDYEPIFLCAPGMAALFSGFETIEMRTRFLDPQEIGTIPARLWRARADLYHSPSFASLVAAPCPWIVTIHDMNHLTYGGAMERAYYETLLRRFAGKAKKVMTVSEFSKGEIERWDRKLAPEVVPNAIDPRFLKAGAEPVDLQDAERAPLARFGVEPDRYFVCLSSEKSHKNVATLVRALAHLRSKAAYRDFRLLTTARGFEGEPGVSSAGNLTDDEAIALLRGSRAVAFPSVYEGFGLPPVEGAVLGAPVIVSDIPAHREALRDLGPSEATWVKPLSEPEWAAALERSAGTARADRAPSTASRAKIAERYSVARLGERMDRIYRSVLDRKPR